MLTSCEATVEYLGAPTLCTTLVVTNVAPSELTGEPGHGSSSSLSDDVPAVEDVEATLEHDLRAMKDEGFGGPNSTNGVEADTARWFKLQGTDVAMRRLVRILGEHGGVVSTMNRL